MTKAVLYLRVSTKEQHTDNQTKDERERMIFQNGTGYSD